VLLAIVAFAALALSAHAADTAEFRTGVFKPSRPAPDFSLRGSNGADFKLSAYRGKVVALGFGYTSCPNVCPTTLLLLAQARQKLGVDAKDFQVVYVTVDPERDNADRMRQFVSAFDPSFIGLTGSPQVIGNIEKDYGIFAKRLPSKGDPGVYFIDHSALVYLIDRSGNLRAMMPFGVPVDDIVHDVKALLAG